MCTALGVGCDTQEQQDQFRADAFAVPSGFTQTDDNGEILSEDEDDWRAAPIHFGRIRIDPAFPNPTGGKFVNVPFSVREFNAFPGGLELASLDANANFVRLDRIPDAKDPGAYVFTFNPTFLARTGLVRVFVIDARGELVSYGDIMVD